MKKLKCFPTKESFDVALLPGMRARLAEAYKVLREKEHDAFKEVLDESGRFRGGIAHVRNCPLCGSSPEGASVVYNVHGMHVVKCNECSMVYSREVIGASADRARYDQSEAMQAHLALHGNDAYAELELSKARYVVAHVQGACHDVTGPLLDIGCSTGAVLRAADEAGWSPLGIDLNGAAIEVAKERGLNAVRGLFPDDISGGSRKFQAITLLDVLEHAESPVDFLALVAKFLLPKGVVAVQVPNLHSLLIRIEGEKNNNICHGHWSYFTAHTLAKVARKAGFEVISVETIISELDRVRAYSPQRVLEAARQLSGTEVDYEAVNDVWIHQQMLGYKIFALITLTCSS